MTEASLAIQNYFQSCVSTKRRKRSESGMNEQTLYASVTVLGPKGTAFFYLNKLSFEYSKTLAQKEYASYMVT